MTELQIKQKAFLDEMLLFYSKNDRSAIIAKTGSRYCKYHREGTHGCAIGRRISDTIAIELDSLTGSINDDRLFDILPDWMKELGVYFLTDVQRLHDHVDNFDDTTHQITKKGLNFLDYILNKYKLNEGTTIDTVAVQG